MPVKNSIKRLACKKLRKLFDEWQKSEGVMAERGKLSRLHAFNYFTFQLLSTIFDNGGTSNLDDFIRHKRSAIIFAAKRIPVSDSAQTHPFLLSPALFTSK